MNKKYLALMIVIGILTIATPAFAAGAVTARIGGMLLDILIPVIGIFAVWAAHRLIKLFEKKSGLDIPDTLETQIDSWVDQGIALADEKSRAFVAAKAEKLKGPEKLELAANFVLDMADKYGLIDKVKGIAKDKVEAKLGITRATPAPAETPVE